jgi:hypothetical protein
MRKIMYVFLIGLLVLIQGCVPASAPAAPAESQATSTIDPATPAAATAAAQAKSAEETQAAQNAQATADALATISAQETADAAVFGTQTAVAQATADQRAFNQTATAQAKQTQAAYAAATQSAMDAYMNGVINDLVTNGFLTTANGSYNVLDPYSASEAMINYYNWDALPYTAKNFVIDTDIAWESASETANWWNSGCGFVFRASNDNNKHYIVFLALDGNVYWYQNNNGNISKVTTGYYGKLENMKGSAHMTLAAEDKLLTVLIDGKKVISRSSAAYDGDLIAYTLVSGTNKGFGTSCEWTNTYLWEVNK